MNRNAKTVARNITRRETASGPRYYVRYRDDNGNRRSRTFRTFEAADRFLKRTEGRVASGEWVDPRKGEILLEDWAHAWLQNKRNLKPKTRAGYESLLRSRIDPAFGERPLGSLGRVEIEGWVDGMVAEGLSPSMIRKAHRLLNAILKAAIRDRIITYNPADGIALPSLSSTSDRRRFLTADEVVRLAEAFEAQPYRALVYLLAYGGLRFGEAVALRRGRVDALRRRIEVKESATVVGGEVIFGSTKNRKSRTVSVPEFVVEELARTLQDRPTDPETLVFTSPTGSVLRYNNFRRRQWDPARERASLPAVTPHDLRHTCASLLRSIGADAKEIQAQLGHSSIAVTFDIYTHLFEGDLDDAMSRLDAAHRGSAGEESRGGLSAV